MALYDPDPVVRRNATFTTGFLAGVLVVMVVWGTLALVHGGGTTSPDGESGALTAAAVSTEQAPCRAVFAAQEAPLRTASKSLEGWRVHVDAMNRLVAGQITLDLARAFWRSTRSAATELLADYERADRRFDSRTVRCPRVAGDTPAGSAEAACRRAVVARTAVLRRASTALATWRTHVRHMEMLREGTMTPTEVTRLWQENRRTGLRQVTLYDGAVRRAGSASC